LIPSPSERFRGWIHLGFFQSIACGVYMYVWSIYPLLIGNLEDILGKTIGNLEYFFSMNLYLSWKLCQVLSHKLSFDDWRIWTPDLWSSWIWLWWYGSGTFTDISNWMKTRAYTYSSSKCFLHYLLVFIWSRFRTEHLCVANTACGRSKSSSIFSLS